VGDNCTCLGVIDKIITGSSSVFIEGKPAARLGDCCAHGGLIITGCPTVLIGEGFVYEKGDDEPEEKPFRKPPPEKRRQMIMQAIEDGTIMLREKLRLLRKKDKATMELFRVWFGRDDDKAKRIIVSRIKKALKVFEELEEENFCEIMDLEKRKKCFASVFSDDLSHTIMLGNPFWIAPTKGRDSKAGVLVHEVSHFVDVGRTRDYEYGDLPCLRLAMYNPDKALFNADSFERFIEL
jgi:hypothetical protein